MPVRVPEKKAKRIKGVFIHPNALVESVEIGGGTRVWAFAHVLKGSAIGKNCNICDLTFIEGGASVGDNVTVKCGVYLWDGVEIGDNVFIGPCVAFTNDPRPRSKAYPKEFQKTVVLEGASIGANSTILGGIKIGKWAMVGAGSVVTKSIPDYTLAYGVPAEARGSICECARDLQFSGGQAKCVCGKEYSKSQDGEVKRVA